MARFDSASFWSLSLLSLALLSAGCPTTLGCPPGQIIDDDGLCQAADAGVGDGGDAAIDLPDGFSPTDGGGIPPDARVLPDVGAIPDGCTPTPYYADADEDGFGDDDVVVTACSMPDGFVADGGDCDDADELRSPGETERCDMAMIDDDCDGTANEGCECYVGQARECPGASNEGECVAGTQTCDEMGRWMTTCTGTIGPSAELCDNLDNDCNGAVDDGAAADAACGSYANGTYECSFGTCVGTCNPTHGDCRPGSALVDAGCETRLAAVTDCSGCGLACGWSCRSATAGCNDAAGPMALGSFVVYPATTCVVRSDRSLACWGSNDEGEAGTGATGTVTTPRVVTALSPASVIDVATGPNHACAIVGTGAATQGSVRCWGANGFGQLGNGTTSDSLVPVTVGGVSDAVELAAGLDMTCARRATGAVSCWGRNVNGSLGGGTTAGYSSAPVTVMNVSGARSVDGFNSRMCAAVSGGGVVCWGQGHTNRETTTLPGTSALLVAVGSAHTCAITSIGGVYCWGENGSGQIGNGSVTDVTTPFAVPGFGGSVVGSLTATSIGAGLSHTCISTNNGRVYCWGANGSGQLGTGGGDVRVPTMLSGLSNVTALASGASYNCAIGTMTGDDPTARRMSCWGAGGSHALGDGATANNVTPAPVLAPL